MFGVEASVADEESTDNTGVPDTPKPKLDTDKDGTSDDEDTDDDNDGAHDRDDTDDDNDNVPDERDDDDDNDQVPDDTDTDDDNDNLPDDQDTDDDNDGIPDEDEDDIPPPTPVPIPAVDNDTIPDDDNGTIPTPQPIIRNDTQQNDTQPNWDYATLSITTVLRANCGWAHPCNNNFVTDGHIDVNHQSGFSPKSKAREGTDHWSVDLPVGLKYHIFVEDGVHSWVYKFDGTYFQGPCQPVAGQLQTLCEGTMTPNGQSVTVNLYYSCEDVAC